FSLSLPRPPRSPLFPYTTLFRSPEIAQHADELCVIRSLNGDSVNHPQSVYQMNTGSILMGHPSVGSWVAYGLGSENRDLPAYVVDRKSTRLNSSHVAISYAVFCL